MIDPNGRLVRALCDANIFISYLLSRAPETSSIGALLKAAADGLFILLFTPAIADEVRSTIGRRPDLAAKIGGTDIDALLDVLDAVSERVPPISTAFPRVGRDPKDDYLIAHAIAAGADLLVSWDKDLLDLGQVAGVRIVTPPGFLEVLRETGRLAR